MKIKLRAWLPRTKVMINNAEKEYNLVEMIKDANNSDENCILMQNSGVVDKNGNDVFEGDYILYDTGKWQNYMMCRRGTVEFAFYRWNDYKNRWQKTTYQGIPTYGVVVGNIYEGTKLKRFYKEMKEKGIEMKGE